MHSRRAGVTRLKQAGCGDELITAIGGHTDPATVYSYYLAVTEEGARVALARRAAYESGHTSNG